MSTKDPFRPEGRDPADGKRFQEKVFDLGEFGRQVFATGLNDLYEIAIKEGWSGRPARLEPMDYNALGYVDRAEPPDALDDPFGHRWSASDQARQRDDRDHPHELDFDR